MGTQSVKTRILPWVLGTALIATAGCGGGSGSTALPPTSFSAATPLSSMAPASTSTAPTAVNFSIMIPGAATSSTVRRTRYISAGTKSATIAVNGTTQIVNCTTTCSATLQVPMGTVTFTAALYDGLNGTGNLLAKGQTQAVMIAGQQNVVQIIFGGVVASVAVALGSSTVTVGTAATIPVVVAPKDNAGYTIAGSETYAGQIVLTNDDTSGATALSTTSLTSPAATATLAYNGAAAGRSIASTAPAPIRRA